MTFNPSQNYTFVSVQGGGIAGKYNTSTIQRIGEDLFLINEKYPKESPFLVSKKNAQAVDHALKNSDFSILPNDDGSGGYDLSIWSGRLTQGSNEWKFGIRSDLVSTFPSLNTLQDALIAIGNEMNST